MPDIGAKEKVLYYPFFCQSWVLTKIIHWFLQQQNEGNLPRFCKRAFVNYYFFFFTRPEETKTRILYCWETFEEHYIFMYILPSYVCCGMGFSAPGCKSWLCPPKDCAQLPGMALHVLKCLHLKDHFLEKPEKNPVCRWYRWRSLCTLDLLPMTDGAGCWLQCCKVNWVVEDETNLTPLFSGGLWARWVSVWCQRLCSQHIITVKRLCPPPDSGPRKSDLFTRSASWSFKTTE